jgi:hypothetical protein
MSILGCKQGDKIRFTGEGGYDSDQERGYKYLTVGEVYTVDIIDIGNWMSDVYLQDFPDIDFNTVMFEVVE